MNVCHVASGELCVQHADRTAYILYISVSSAVNRLVSRLGGTRSDTSSKGAPQWLGSGLYRCTLMLGVANRSIQAVQHPNRVCSVDRMRDFTMPARVRVGMLSREPEPDIASGAVCCGWMYTTSR